MVYLKEQRYEPFGQDFLDYIGYQIISSRNVHYRMSGYLNIFNAHAFYILFLGSLPEKYA